MIRKLIILTILMFCGCNSSQIMIISHGPFTLLSSDYNFADYHLMPFKDNNGKIFFVLSKKNEHKNKDLYDSLVVGRTYSFDIVEIDTTVLLKSKNNVNKIISGNEVIWSNDTLYMKVYGSEQIAGKYVKK